MTDGAVGGDVGVDGQELTVLQNDRATGRRRHDAGQGDLAAGGEGNAGRAARKNRSGERRVARARPLNETARRDASFGREIVRR